MDRVLVTQPEEYRVILTKQFIHNSPWSPAYLQGLPYWIWNRRDSTSQKKFWVQIIRSGLIFLSLQTSRWFLRASPSPSLSFWPGGFSTEPKQVSAPAHLPSPLVVCFFTHFGLNRFASFRVFVLFLSTQIVNASRAFFLIFSNRSFPCFST